MSLKRILSTVMFSDIRGYTSLMQNDERKAFQILDIFQKVLEEVTSESGGKVVKNYGDGSIVIFQSAFTGVQAAIKIQKILYAQNIPVRIGMDLGDVTHKAGDVYGDTINISSRIESAGIAGSVLISHSLQDKLCNQKELIFKDLGLFQFKNVRKPMQIYAIQEEGLVIPDRSDIAVQKSNKNPSLHYVLLIIMTLLLLFISWKSYHIFFKDTKKSGSVAVMAFDHNGRSEDAFLTRGISEDIITYLGSFDSIKVLSRFTLSRYNETNQFAIDIGKALNVNYIITGSTQFMNDKVSVSCQLVDVKDNTETWAESYEVPPEKIYEIHKDIAKKVVSVIKNVDVSKLDNKGNQNISDDLIAHNYYLKGRDKLNDETEESNLLAIAYFKKAIENDVKLAHAWAGIAIAQGREVKNYFNKPIEYLDSALMSANQGLALNSEVAETWYGQGDIYRKKINFKAAINAFRKALSYNSNYYPALSALSSALILEGELVEAEKILKRSIELYPINDNLYSSLGNLYRRLGMSEQAMKMFQKAIQLNPGVNRSNYYNLAFAYIMMQKFDLADQALQNFIIDNPQTLTIAAYFYLFFDKEKAHDLIQEVIQHPDYDPSISYLTPILQAFLLKESGEKEKAENILENRYQYYRGRVSLGEQEMLDLVLMADIACVRGEKDSCLNWLKKAIEAGEKDFNWYRLDPLFEIVWDDPRFIEMMNQLEEEVRIMRLKVEENSNPLLG